MVEKKSISLCTLGTLHLKVVQTIARQAMEFLDVNVQIIHGLTAPRPGFTPQVWKPHYIIFVKLNCDGAWVKRGLIRRIGVVTRNKVGDVLAFLGK